MAKRTLPDAPPVTGVFTTELPFPVRLDLDRLG
jgi:hypothetical protein